MTSTRYARCLLPVLAAALAAVAPPPLLALQSGFVRSTYADGLSRPTAMAFAPDGRLFVAEQGGRLRVVKDGVLLPTPFLTVAVDSDGERGLLGVTFDPQFFVNGLVYVYYTTRDAPVHNRVSRFTAAGDVAAPGSETAILDLETLSGATNHNGGALHFGPDGKLYVAVGENANGANAQTLANRLGKLLRVGADGSIPADNPFVAGASGANRAIWALGLRNPFTFAFQPVGERLLVNDVGEGTWEEVNDGRAGANYGWPETEGPSSDPRFVSPLFAYRHGPGVDMGCAVAGGAFYDPEVVQFPPGFLGSYFFADFCGGWVRRLGAGPGNPVTGFATGFDLPTDLRVGPDGSLYVLARGTGAVFRIHSAAWPQVSDADRDGIPDGVEAQEGRDPTRRDNDVFASARLFTRQQYRDLVRREGDASGLAFWAQALNAGVSRQAIVRAFLDSPEFDGLFAGVTRLHRAAQGDRPDEVSLRHWQERRRTGSSLADVAEGVAAAAAFRLRYGALGDEAYVRALYRDVLQRAADPAGLAYWRQQLAAGAPRGQVLLGFAESAEFTARARDGAFVTQLYASLLRRRADVAGFAFFVDLLRRGVPRLEVIRVFLESAEYRARFAS